MRERMRKMLMHLVGPCPMELLACIAFTGPAHAGHMDQVDPVHVMRKLKSFLEVTTCAVNLANYGTGGSSLQPDETPVGMHHFVPRTCSRRPSVWYWRRCLHHQLALARCMELRNFEEGGNLSENEKQHHCFLDSDQPCLVKWPASQSYGNGDCVR